MGPIMPPPPPILIGLKYLATCKFLPHYARGEISATCGKTVNLNASFSCALKNKDLKMLTFVGEKLL